MRRKQVIIILFSILVLTSVVVFWLVIRSGRTGVVGTSTTAATITTNFQRKTFYASGYHWMFYCNGSHILYTASSDGFNWKTPAIVRTGISSSGISVWYDGNVHYAYAPGTPDSPVIYCRGSISGNKIEWEAERIVAAAVLGLEYYNAYCLTDSDGYPWAAYMQYDDLHWNVCVVKAVYRNGNAWTAPNEIFNSTSYTPWRICILPLEQSKLCAIYASTIGVKVKLWNATAWGTEENVTTAHLTQDYGFSAVSYDDNVHLVLLENQSYNILYFKRTIETGWNPEAIIQRNQSSISFPVLCMDELTSSLYCFWIREKIIYMKKCVGGIWEDSTSNLVSAMLDTPVEISCFCKVWNREIGVAWVEQPGISSYRLRYQSLKV